MKKRIKVILPVPMPQEAVDIFKTQFPQSLKRSDIDYEWIATKNGANILDSYYDSVLSDVFVMSSGVRAEEEGFSAVCVNSMSDSGLKGLRSRLTIPVFGPCHTSFLTACMLGKKFSVITMWDEWFHMYKKTLQEEGIENRCASIRSINVRPDTKELLNGKEDFIFEKLLDESNKAIKQDGADVLILGSTTMHQSYSFLKENLEVPILNPGVIAFKLCEMFLDMDLTHSKVAYPSPEKNNDFVLDNVPVVGF
jgi:allantoin racemase